MEYDVDNGILAQVPGGCSAAGIDGLPPPGPNSPQELKAVVDAQWLGQVEITYRVMSHKHRKSVFWFWTPVYARQVPQKGGNDADGARADQSS